MKLMEAAPNTDALDQQFKEFIQALKKAVGTGIPHLKDDPKVVDQAIADCKEILGRGDGGQCQGVALLSIGYSLISNELSFMTRRLDRNGRLCRICNR